MRCVLRRATAKSCETPPRDLDQIHADLRSPKQLAQRKTSKPAEDLPGLGQWYCIECAKWFEGEHNLVQHTRGKNHKRRFCIPSNTKSVLSDDVSLLIAVRLRLLRDEPYSQKEAEAAVGLSTDNGIRNKEKAADVEEQLDVIDVEEAQEI